MESTLAAVVLLSGVNYGLVDYILKPLKDAYPEQSKGWWFLIYVPLVTGFAITYVAGLNLFTEVVPSMNPTLGLVLTSILAGAGNNILYRVFGRKPEIIPSATLEVIGGG